MRFDWFGFIALAVGIGALQLLLDRGEQVGWYGANEIWVETIVSVAGFYYFFAHSLTTAEPFVRFEMFKDRNFVSGCVFMAVIGVVLFGTMALVTPFMQNLLGYPIQTAGFLLGSRGVGTLLTMLAAPRLMKAVEPRYLILCGLLITAATLYQMTGFSLDTTQRTIVIVSVLQGIGLGLLVCAGHVGCIQYAAGRNAQRCDGDHDAAAQYWFIDRHFHDDRQFDQQDHADA